MTLWVPYEDAACVANCRQIRVLQFLLCFGFLFGCCFAVELDTHGSILYPLCLQQLHWLHWLLAPLIGFTYWLPERGFWLLGRNPGSSSASGIDSTTFVKMQSRIQSLLQQHQHVVPWWFIMDLRDPRSSSFRMLGDGGGAVILVDARRCPSRTYPPAITSSHWSAVVLW